MPELPDLAVYIDALERRILGERLERVRLASPFLLRSVDPPLSAADGQRVEDIRRVGKRIAIGLSNDVWLVIHLMIAGRFRWDPPGAPIPRRLGLAALDFESGALLLTEAGTKKRASLRVVAGASGLAGEDPGGLEPLDADLDAFRARITLRNHTLKRALTDPGLFSGIGNAYSDEILWATGLSPIKWTRRLDAGEIERLFDATQRTLTEWTERLRAEAGGDFPKKVTAFRPDMAVHGKHDEPCPSCGSPVQRIRYAENETNYCATCQTGGKVLADRALSRLLGKDWPRTLDELEALRSGSPDTGSSDP
ncbi:MAG: DNA-formamidopyrimidine glycosylase family protein [Gemmatimonadota bacterium]|nr:DNA-formamidopyrimidine glycosylase family protein [Gemmatimonadota bacterium]